MKKYLLTGFLIVSVMNGCLSLNAYRPLPWGEAPDEIAEAEYAPYLQIGNNTLIGQAFLVQKGGGIVEAAGREVTLDPATSIGQNWWKKAGGSWQHRYEMPPSTGFTQARKRTTADAYGRFKFHNIAPGHYFIRTEVIWDLGKYGGLQGGLVGKRIEIKEGEITKVILDRFEQQTESIQTPAPDSPPSS